jgi:PKHD-type hydroxylase
VTNEPFVCIPWFDDEEVDRIICAAAREPEHAGEAYRAEPGYRVCAIRRFTDEWLTKKVLDLFRFVNERAFGFDIDRLAEPLQHISYGPGGHYGWHVDRGAPVPRKLSLTVQLTDESEYDGGDLEVWSGKDPERAPRKKGTAIVFPAYALHRVTPITHGLRQALVVWAHGPEFR